MIELPTNFDSVFRYIVVVSQRAEQLIVGAKPRTESRHAKPTLIARDDVDAGRVEWRVLTQEELDAQRQAIVEQFRAEVAGDDFAPEAARLVPDVLPTLLENEEVQADDEDRGDREDELSRLQRLLGMSRGKASDAPGIDLEVLGADDELSSDDDEDLLDVDDGELLDVDDDE